MSDVKDVERSMSNIVNLLHEANEPAGGLATKFGSFTTESKGMEILMRFASGSGLWKAMNYAKAVGITISQWNKGAQEFRKLQSEMYGALSKQLKTEKDLAKLKSTSQNLYAVKNDTQNKLAMEALKKQKETENERRKHHMDFMNAHPGLIGPFIEMTDIQKTQLGLYEDMANVMEDDLYQGMKAMYGEEFARLQLLKDSTKALDEQAKKQSEINELMSNKDIEGAMKLQAGKPLSADAMRAAKEGQKRGLGKIKGGQFVENKGFNKFIKMRLAKIGNNTSKLWKFAGGLKKMIWSYLKSAMLVFGQLMIYLVLLLIGFMLAKKVYQHVKKSWSKFSGTFGTLKENWDTFMGIFNKWIMPEVTKLLVNLKTLWALLKDPKAGLWDTFLALLKVVWSLTKVIFGTIIALWAAVIAPFVLKVFFTLGDLVVRYIIWVKDGIVNFFTSGKLGKIIKGIMLYFKIGISLLKVLGYSIMGIFTDKKENKAKAQEERRKVLTYGTELAGLVGLHTGGTVTKSGAFVVGERGPELLHLPKGSAVTPNTGGNTINVHVNGRVGASDSELRDIARKVGAMINREINRTTNAGVRL